MTHKSVSIALSTFVAAAVMHVGCSDRSGCETGAAAIPSATPVYKFSLSRDSRIFATIGPQRVIHVRDAVRGRMRHVLEIENRWPVCIAFYPTRDALLCVYRDCSIVRWDDVSTGSPRHTELQSGSGEWVVECASDGCRTAIVNNRNELILHENGSLLWQRNLESGRWTTHLSFSPDGRFLLSCEANSGMCRWNVATGECQRLTASRQKSIRSACIAPDGLRVSTAGFDGRLREWDIRGNRELWSQKLSSEPLTAVCYTPDGQSIAAGTFPGEILLINASSPREECRIAQLASSISQLTFTPDGILHVSSQGGNMLSLRWEGAGRG